MHCASRDEYSLTTAVLLLDLDEFKTVNDSMGHTAGDALLVEVAARAAIGAARADTAARLGGDEFAILLEDLGRQRRRHRRPSQRVIDVLAAPFRLVG